MALKDSAKLISHALTTLSNVIETDTDISTIDLNLLENLNTNQSLNYIKLEQNLNVLEKDAERLEQLHEEFQSYSSMLNDIDTKVAKIEIITKELDEWTKELESKLKNKR